MVRRHAHWLPELNWGLMHYTEVGINRAKDLKTKLQMGSRVRRSLFYLEPDPEDYLAPFNMGQLAAAFALLGVGLAIAALAFTREAISRKNK